MKKGVKTIASIAGLLVLGGCVSTHEYNLVADAQNEPVFSLASLKCDKPFNLTKDCSGWSGPTKKIMVSRVKMKVAGSEDGKTVLVFPRKTAGPANICYEIAKRKLVSENIKIMKVTPIGIWGDVAGYAIETDKPNYQLWDQYKTTE